MRWELLLLLLLSFSSFGQKQLEARYTTEKISIDGILNETARLRGPAGLYIGSKTPAEIALSILAEIVAAKNGITLPAQLQVAAAKDALADAAPPQTAVCSLS